MVVHQSNHIRLQQLRQTAESLDSTLKNTIQLLADTRKEILDVPTFSADEQPKREVGVDELLAYAKFISKTTVPPTFRKQEIPAPAIKSENTNVQITNGIATPPSGVQESNGETNGHTANIGTKALNAESKSFLDPLQGLPFEPWPSHEVIQRGALADIQRIVESGQDPGSILTAEEQAMVDEKRKEDEERERLAQEEAERRRMSMFDTGQMRRRGTMNDVFNPDDL